ncbi:chymotrypsin-1-like [Prorops nasuta]|uniref:chymotrypsin-1-like n=1 Tax=Prorops nasuta TaxID=863751 RepID=UPI0034CF6C18
MQAIAVLLFAGLSLCIYGLPSGRIVGGHDASEGKYPYLAVIKVLDQHYCAGSIVNKRFILTTAQCIPNVPKDKVKITVGVTDLENRGEDYYVESYIAHPKFDFGKRKNDVALIKVDKDIKFSEKVQPIELLSKEHTEKTYLVILTGWGTKSEDGDYPNKLQVIQLNTITNEACSHPHPDVTGSQICTLTRRDEGACYGDSGDPLVDQQGKQVGIMSFGAPCALGIPDVYTRISYFYKFITENSKL